MTTTATLRLDGTLRLPAHSLFTPASQTVHLLHAHLTQQHQTSLTADDEASAVESVENLTDVEITLQELDLVYWKELADRRWQTTGKSPLRSSLAALNWKQG